MHHQGSGRALALLFVGLGLHLELGLELGLDYPVLVKRSSTSLLLAVIAFLAGIRSGEAQSIAGSAEEAWTQRDRGFETELDPEPTRRAIRLWEAELAAHPEDEELPFRLMEGWWFDATFLEADSARREAAADRVLELAEDALSHLPPQGTLDPVRAHFWAAIAWGFWGMSHGNLAAATHGVATKVRDHATRVAELDPAWADGGGHRLLGRLHTVAPKVPFFTGWIDRGQGIALLEQALATSDADPRNGFFLAEALLKYRPDRRDEALQLLRELAVRAPRPAYRVEDEQTLASARRRLREERP